MSNGQLSNAGRFAIVYDDDGVKDKLTEIAHFVEEKATTTCDALGWDSEHDRALAYFIGMFLVYGKLRAYLRSQQQEMINEGHTDFAQFIDENIILCDSMADEVLDSPLG